MAARGQLAGGLAGRGLGVYPSAANFLLVGAPGGDALAFADGLADAGVGVRPFPDLPRAGDCVRVTVGPRPMMERLLARTTALLSR